ncbi:MAG TPA: YeeE/YedE family protein [Polyangia bacterium]
MHNFTPVPALIGGVLIGLAASLLLLTHGRRAAISGLWAGLFHPKAHDRALRVYFFAGLVGVGLLSLFFAPQLLGQAQGSLGRMLSAGILVGYGTQLGGGCTSGHGVCGISRFELRSVLATLTFILTGALAVLALRALS